MPPLDPSLRKLLDSAVIKARDETEKAARAALSVLGVEAKEAPTHLTEQDRRLRVALRAKQRQLENNFELLVQDLAYEQWHRMLFARFLAENDLLMHPSGVAVTLEECAELAAEEGEADRWIVAANYASAMLPGIFLEDDPCVKVRLAPEGRQALEAILDSLPSGVFTADDSLGWVYQFWQTKRKDEVNDRGDKIGGADLAPVTQLFTEHYMVSFLLENSLGAWWASCNPDSPVVKEFSLLRFTENDVPAAGGFEGWPDVAREITVMDPCCGSGHFLVTAFEMLKKMRMEQEDLSEPEAAEAVLRDNLFGLELDPRCTQIAAFALGLAAWKAGGYRPLPLPNIACSGLGTSGQLEDWKSLAKGNEKLEGTLEQLHTLFKNAFDLGSLIDPKGAASSEDLFAVDYSDVAPLLEEALSQEQDDPAMAVFGAAAAGTARAAQLLSKTYTIVATNVPFLKRGRQSKILKDFSDHFFPAGRADLATTFLERWRESIRSGGATAVVLPQNWLFLKSFGELRKTLLVDQEIKLIARLGAGAFETISGEVVNVTLNIFENRLVKPDHKIYQIETLHGRPVDKEATLATGQLSCTAQSTHTRNADFTILIDEHLDLPLLAAFASSLQGISPADLPRFGRVFWEIQLGEEWVPWQGSPEETQPYAGRHKALWWNSALMKAIADGSAFVRGTQAWGKVGVAVNQMGSLPATMYSGDRFDTNVAVILPHQERLVGAIWHFCSSSEYQELVRKIDASIKVTNATLGKVPFDPEKWQKIADAAGPLPEPYSNDPTQWLFKGNPKGSTRPLHVAVARLVGYRWPDQESDGLEQLADADGIVCLPAVAGEAPAAERLRSLLSLAYTSEWSHDSLDQLLAIEGLAGKDLATWLRDKFFDSHSKLFHHRPFVWHIWDGKKDGFSALINYHKLDQGTLDKLIYTHLGWWINTQRSEAKSGKTGAEPRLVAAIELQRKLEAIRGGEQPYDIYVRWKSKSEQPIGWDPDPNDGVRLNIRPFVTAGVLRSTPNIKWGKDRGRDPDGSERINDLHLTRAEKKLARKNR